MAPRKSSNESQQPDLRKKPYGFVPLPGTFATAEPVWHDGSGAAGRLSGEVRLELTTLTPLLVGWERRRVHDEQAPDDPWRIPFEWVDRENDIVDVLVGGRLRTVATKAALCPLRAPWGDWPVLIPGDSLKGLLRHELGSLLGAPMERVAERSYSYRPNTLFPKDANPRMRARLARVPEGGVMTYELEGVGQVRVPTELELLAPDLRYDREHRESPPRYRFDPAHGIGEPYRGGLGAGVKLNSKRELHARLDAEPKDAETVAVPADVQEGYLHTLRHLSDTAHGHFSERHPDLPKVVSGDEARLRILTAARKVTFQPGDLIWVEWDTREERILSFGWHYYYRWAYQDTVRRRGRRTDKRAELFPDDAELRKLEDGSPERLTAVRRLFGYVGDIDDCEGSGGIGAADHSQLMGRLSVNAAIEVVTDGSSEPQRFLEPTFLRELGMPRPSAVEHYLKQPYWPTSRPLDRAKLVTYGDAAGYDKPGELTGRKYYLDRPDAYTGESWADDSERNNDRSTLALEASRPGRRFRFTVRFRDLDPGELAAVLLALCPDQLAGVVGGDHPDGYCSKLGYARPLGWGSVRIEAKELHLLVEAGGEPALSREEPTAWFREHRQEIQSAVLSEWLEVHRHKHPDADDYPRSQKDGEIFTFHTTLRAEHSRARRYDPESGR